MNTAIYRPQQLGFQSRLLRRRRFLEGVARRTAAVGGRTGPDPAINLCTRGYSLPAAGRVARGIGHVRRGGRRSTWSGPPG